MSGAPATVAARPGSTCVIVVAKELALVAKARERGGKSADIVLGKAEKVLKQGVANVSNRLGERLGGSPGNAVRSEILQEVLLQPGDENAGVNHALPRIKGRVGVEVTGKSSNEEMLRA